jgi:hypothetical protein
MSYSHRIFIYGPVALLLAVVAAYIGFWFYSADHYGKGLDAANGSEIVPGVHFAFAEKEIGGFPFRMDIVLDGVTFAYRSAAGETAWRSEKLAIHALSYNDQQFVFEAAGLQSIAWPGDAGKAQVLYVTPGTAHASAQLRGGKLVRFDLDLVNVQLEDATAGKDSGRSMNAARAQFHIRASGQDKADVVVQLDSARIGSGYPAPLGRDIKSLVTAATLTHANAFDALRQGNANIKDAAEAWRRAGGAALIDKATLTSETASDAILTGRFALDTAREWDGMLSQNGGTPQLTLQNGELH